MARIHVGNLLLDIRSKDIEDLLWNLEYGRIRDAYLKNLSLLLLLLLSPRSIATQMQKTPFGDEAYRLDCPPFCVFDSLKLSLALALALARPPSLSFSLLLSPSLPFS